MNFIKKVLASLMVKIVSLLVFVLLIIIVAFFVKSKSSVKIEDNTILEINLSENLLDYTPVLKNPFNEILTFKEDEVGFNNICKAIESASYDSRISGISLRNIPANIGWSQVTTFINILKEFKAQNKFIYAFDDVYSQKKYYLNTVADSLFLSPLGRVEFKGLNSEVMFYKSFQEKYDVKMEVIRHGKYKSAVEPFIADEMSDENRHQISELIHSLWREIDQSVSSQRKINVNEAVDSLVGKSSKSSLKFGLVDGLVYEDEYKEKLRSKAHQKEFKKVSIQDYVSQTIMNSLPIQKEKIAVVYAQGNIQYGYGSLKTIGHQKIVKTLNSAAKDDDVKAIVFRINSPGGSALASELIWRAVVKAKEKKPVIVSMGNYAASGGYYIAAPADKIFAEPTTITGSIGVFGMLPNVSTLVQNNGINTELVSTHQNGAHYSPFLPVDKRFKDLVKMSIEEIYDVFLERVAQGRAMNVEEVDEIAQGRVWTGVKAKEIGLIDELGGLEQAIVYAAKKVALENYGLQELPSYEVDFKGILDPGSFLKSNLGLNKVLNNTPFKNLGNIKDVLTTKGVQAQIPFEMEIN